MAYSFTSSECNSSGSSLQKKLACIFVFSLFSLNNYAHAQSAQCFRYREELASLERRGPGSAMGMVERQRSELNRLVSYYRSQGCERGPFALFRGAAPPQCSAISARIGRMEQNLGRLNAQAGGAIGHFEANRQRLTAGVARYCNNEQPVKDNRNFLDNFFNGPATNPNKTEKKPRASGTRLVCVRACDGFYFPLNNTPGGQGNADTMCQALCPETPTSAYRMPNMDGGIGQAVSLKGQRYSSLANAMRYSERVVPNCSCKADNETWASVLGPAEKMLRRRPGDILITEKKSDEMAQPKLSAKEKAQKLKEEQELAKEVRNAERESSSLATASNEESGILTHTTTGATRVSSAEGPRAIIVSEGQEKTIRIIAPQIIPPPPNTF